MTGRGSFAGDVFAAATVAVLAGGALDEMSANDRGTASLSIAQRIAATPAQSIALAGASAAASGDFNADGFDDLAVATASAQGLVMFTNVAAPANTGRRTFATPPAGTRRGSARERHRGRRSRSRRRPRPRYRGRQRRAEPRVLERERRLYQRFTRRRHRRQPRCRGGRHQRRRVRRPGVRELGLEHGVDQQRGGSGVHAPHRRRAARRARRAARRSTRRRPTGARACQCRRRRRRLLEHRRRIHANGNAGHGPDECRRNGRLQRRRPSRPRVHARRRGTARGPERPRRG